MFPSILSSVSLSTLIRQDASLRALLKEMIRRPRFSRPELLAPAVSRRANLTGTAFDYLLRFELLRRYRGLPIEQGWWIARLALRHAPKPRLSKRFLDEAQEQVALYAQGYGDTLSLAQTCTVLAKFDLVYRAGWADPQWLVPDEEIAAELTELLALVPFEDMRPRQRLILNPSFGEASLWVGGADADLVVDGCLIDIKTVMDARLKLDELYQLVGYAALAGLGGLHVADSPATQRPVHAALSRAALYYARHGLLVSFELDELLEPGGLERVQGYLKREYAGSVIPVNMSR